MDQPDLEIAAAWREAARDLGIRVIAPFSYRLCGEDWMAPAYVLDFGRLRGTITGYLDAQIDRKRLDEGGYFWSLLGEGYRLYDRLRFRETLDDWRWFGPGRRPDWYTGRVWRSR